MTIYSERIQKFQKELDRLKRQSLQFSTFRFVTFFAGILGIYFYYFRNLTFSWTLILLGFLSFLVLVRVSNRLAKKIKIQKNLVEINEDEFHYLTEGKLSYLDGKEFIDTQHSFTFDLDFFGSRSLFQHLNRTCSYIGSESFAKKLTSILASDKILEHQKAIEELKNKLDWRHDFASISKYISDQKKDYEFLINWSQAKNEKLPFVTNILSFLLPSILIGLAIYIGFTKDVSLLNVLFLLFLLNLGVFSTQLKKITYIIKDSERIEEITSGYGLLLEKIEKETFQSDLLKDIQKRILDQNESASKELKKLSVLFSDLNNMQNAVGAIFLNGLFLYHLHRFRSFGKWKALHGKKITNWLECIGEMEALSSFGNFAFNNPNFAFPTINTASKIEFKELGHPLISSEKRVCNDISFEVKNFSILTGSNMSGKSTFLRTLGINMVLAGTGSVVCAKEATVQPLPVFVSMRQTDSLADSESYFFAEVKRLKYLMEEVEKRPSFVLLDEILRGTNSDDKQSGTIGFIRKLMKHNVVGMIATHDIEVCKTEQEFPEKITNRCFEVEIINDELHFDYQLRNGICQNKSATFLMKKMDIIE